MSDYKLNEQVFIDSHDGRYTPALFKGDINNALCYVAPKARFRRGGYGTTVTCLTKHITRKPVFN